jgi:plastocyanin
MRFVKTGVLTLGILLSLGTAVNFAVLAENDGHDDEDSNVAIIDKCDPADPAWNPTGGCALKPRQGDVTFAEFNAFLFSPLGPAGLLIGHPAWRNDPSYLTLHSGKAVRVTNKGGRTHTFTEVADFGGGFVPPLNGALGVAPECNPLTTTALAPGDKINVKGLAAGLHKFQCCIHPWMRAAVRVE